MGNPQDGFTTETQRAQSREKHREERMIRFSSLCLVVCSVLSVSLW